MSKLLLTNNSSWSSLLRDSFKKAGFKEFSSVGNKEYFTVYKKLKVKSYNCYFDGDDYAACTGTFIYKKAIGKQALKLLLNDADNFDLNEIRKNSVGSYAVVIKKSSKIYVFVDEFHTYSLFYFISDKDYLITNTFYHIENLLKKPINQLKAIEYVAQFNIVDSNTPYEDIYKLLGNEFIQIDLALEKQQVVKVKPRKIKKYNFLSLEDAAKAYSDKILEYAQLKKTLFKKSCIFMTGGADSRLVLASYLSVGSKPKLYRWHGREQILNTQTEDFIVSKKIAKSLHLPLKSFNVIEDFERTYNKTTGKDFNKYGELTLKYGNNQKWHKLYNKLNVDFVDYGYFGETLVGWAKIDDMKDFGKSITLRDFILKIYVNSLALKGVVNKQEYIEMLYNEFAQLTDQLNLDKEALTKEDCMYLFFQYRLHADTHMCNFTNMYYYHFPILCQPELADIAHSVPYKFKHGHKFNLYVTKLLYEKLLDFTYFCHCQYRQMDKDNLELSFPTQAINQLQSRLSKALLKIKGICREHKDIDRDNYKVKMFCVKEIQNLNQIPTMQVDEESFSYIPLFTTLLLLSKMNYIINIDDMR